MGGGLIRHNEKKFVYIKKIDVPYDLFYIDSVNLFSLKVDYLLYIISTQFSSNEALNNKLKT